MTDLTQSMAPQGVHRYCSSEVRGSVLFSQIPGAGEKGKSPVKKGNQWVKLLTTLDKIQVEREQGEVVMVAGDQIFSCLKSQSPHSLRGSMYNSFGE